MSHFVKPLSMLRQTYTRWVSKGYTRVLGDAEDTVPVAT